jgi:O-antigen biosynthesis protein
VTTIQRVREAEGLPASDAAVAVSWESAYTLLSYQQTRKKFYVIQDDEPRLLPPGSASAIAEATYSFGFFGLCGPSAILEEYRKRGGEGESFTPCVDRSLFHSKGRTAGSESRKMVIFDAKPDGAGDCFELVSEAVRMVKRRLGDQVCILAAGLPGHPAGTGLAGIVENFGGIDYRLAGALFRKCDVGITVGITPNPSNLALELMACGALLVTNANERTSWLLKDRLNCLVAPNSATGIADAVEAGILNRELRAAISQTAAELVARDHSDWSAQAEKVYQCMLGQC